MKLSNPLKYAISTILAGIMILFLVIYVEHKTISVGNENTPLVSLAEHVKNKSKEAHIWFEKAMKRDKSVVFHQDMYASLDSTVQLFKKVLDGGETELGVFHQTTNIEINNTLKQLLLNSEDLKLLAEQRMLIIMRAAANKRKGKSANKTFLAKGEEVGGKLDQAFDASYEKLQGNYEGLATLVKMKISQDNNVLNNLFWVSVLLITVVFSVLSFLLYKISNKELLAGNALIMSERRFRAIFEEAPLGIALIDPITGLIHEINPKYSEIIGRSKSEMNNTDWMSITHPDDLQEGVTQKSLMNEHKLKSFKISKRYIHSDGSTVWGDVSIASIETGDKSQHLQLCMVQDITERKKSEEKIKESQENYRSLVDNVTDIIMTVDLEDKITFINFAGGGYNREQIIGGSVYNFVSPEYHEFVKRAHTKVKESKTPQSYETTSLGLDGVSRWFLTNVGPIFSGDNVAGITLFTKDITNRKRTEEALTSSENELRAMFACMDDVIFELDSNGTYLKIAPTNPSLLYKPADLVLGKKLSDVFPKQQAEWFLLKILQTLKEKKNIQVEYMLSIDDREITFEATISALSDNSVLCIARDITARKKAESDTIQSQINFENAQKLAQIGSWEFNLLTSQLVWSKELYRIFELEDQSTMGLYESYRNKFHPDDLIKLDNATNNAIQKGLAYNFEHRILSNNRAIKYLSCIGEAIMNDKGIAIGLKGTCQDITDRKKMETLLNEKKQNALLIRHAAQVPGIIYQFQIFPDGKLLWPFISEGIWDLCGITAEEVMLDGNKIFTYTHPDDIDNLMKSIKVSMESLENWNHEFRINLPAKGAKWLRGNSKPEKLEDGSVLWHGYLTDITESKQAKEALQISKDKQEAVFNGSNDAIMLLTKKGFFDCNPKTLEMFGMSDRKEFIESHPSDSSPALQADGQNSLIKANAMIDIAYEKGINRFEWLHQRKNGEVFPAEVLLSAFNYGDERVLQATVQDITQRKLVEKRLIEFKHFFNNSGDFACIANTQGYFETINQNFEKVLGYSEKELLENEFICFVHPDDIDSTIQEVEKLKTGALTTSFVNRYRKKDGTYLWFSWNASPNTETGKLYAIARDITYQKITEEKIKKSEEKYRSVVDNAVDMIITFDRDNKIQFINHTRPGITVEQVIGTSIYNYIPPEHLEQATEKIKKAFEGEPQSYEMRALHSDGTYAWYASNLGPIFSEDVVIGVTLIIREISERIEAEEKIKKSEEKYRSVVENAADMIITFDNNYLITFANHLRPGTQVENIIGTSIYNLIPEAYQGHVKEKIKMVFESKKPQGYELPGQHYDGSTAWYSANLGPVFSGEEVSGITLILRDITDSKKAKEKIQQSLKEKEILLQEVHHRVKNNLQIILSILNLQNAHITDKKTLDLVRDIRSRIKAMSFIHELLYQTDDFSSINFSEYITNITNNLVYSYTQDHKINLKLNVGAIFLDLDRAIPCGLIINEIVTNALKYAFTDQEEGEVSVSLTQKNEFIHLIIADNGKGFPVNIDYKNTESLGLQLVVTLVQQLGGEIALDNSNGVKYTITFKMINKDALLIKNDKTLENKNAY
ncbi:MAG: PAS domain S-box protein [Bacteroidota bacterium]